jgi:hypothetical protein
MVGPASAALEPRTVTAAKIVEARREGIRMRVLRFVVAQRYAEAMPRKNI